MAFSLVYSSIRSTMLVDAFLLHVVCKERFPSRFDGFCQCSNKTCHHFLPWRCDRHGVVKAKNSNGNRKLCSHIVDVGGLHTAELDEEEDGRCMCDILTSNISHLPYG